MTRKLKLSNFQFETFLTVYEEYKQEFGDKIVPFSYITWSGYPLGCMLYRFKTGRYELTNEQRAILAGRLIPTKRDNKSDGEVDGVPFDEIVARIGMYKDRFGNTRVPKTYLCGDGFCLGYFASVLRKMYNQNALSDAQKQTLDNIGFETTACKISTVESEKKQPQKMVVPKNDPRSLDENYVKQQEEFDRKALKIWEEYMAMRKMERSQD